MFLSDPDVTLWHGDVLETLREFPAESVDCVVTSPPYWGLRDYGTGAWEGGDAECDHVRTVLHASRDSERPKGWDGNFRNTSDPRPIGYASECGKCGATRIDQQLGLEPTPEQYVERMVEVFREVRRVLAAHGTVWLNLGDSYIGGGSGDTRTGFNARYFGKPEWNDGKQAGHGQARAAVRLDKPERDVRVREAEGSHGELSHGLRAKNLVGIPWRVAFALQADGWYLRSDIIWSKPNPMPESVTDRPTKAHEMVFLLAKGPWIGREPGPIETRLSREDARWLALLVDAEGNICVKRVAPQGDNSPQYGAQIAIGSTSRELLERAAALVGAGNVNERKGTNAPMFYWQVSNKVAQDLLYAIYPHLIVKPRQAQIAIHLESLLYHRGNATKRTERENAALESLWLRNKECNQFGSPDLADVPAPKYGKWGASRYFFDQEAVREAYKYDGRKVTTVEGKDGSIQHRNGERWPGIGKQSHAARASLISHGHDENEPMEINHAGRNIRSVWEIATQPYPEAHFATFPEELARRCIAAGCPEQVCRVCGKARERIVERQRLLDGEPYTNTDSWSDGKQKIGAQGVGHWRFSSASTDCGFTNCGCLSEGEQSRCSDVAHASDSTEVRSPSEKYRPGIVLDPFMGSGTVAYVARKLGRHSIGIDLSAEYLELAARRLQQQSLFAEAAS